MPNSLYLVKAADQLSAAGAVAGLSAKHPVYEESLQYYFYVTVPKFYSCKCP
jgi:hypothetical protein